ncbi:unnamed protein product, partial [Prorocentrum cordatum]
MVPRAAAADLSPAAREAEAAPPDQPASPVMTDSLEPRTAATVEEEQPAAAFQGIVDRASPAGEPADLVPAALEVAEAAESGRLASLAAAGELELEVAEVAESERLASLAAAGDLEPEASLASACGPQPTAKEEREADAAESAAGQALPVASAGQDAPPDPPADLGIRAPPVTAAAPQPAAVEEEAVTADLHDAVDVASPAAAAGPSLADREVAEAGRPACPAMAADLGPRACPATPAAVQQAAEEEERAASAFEDLVDQEALAAVAADPSPAVREVAEAAPPDRPASPDMDHDFGPRTSPAAAAVQLTAAEDGAPTAAFERVVDEALPAAVADPLAGVQKIAQAVPKDQPINLVPQTSQAAATAAKSAAEEDEEKEEASVAADLQAAVEQISPAIVAAEPLPAAKEVAEASPPDRPHSMAVAAAQLPLEEELGAAADLQGVAEQISPALVAAEPMPAVEEVAEAAPPDRPPSLAAASDPEPGPPLETAMAVQFAPEDEEGAAAELLGAVAPAATAADVPPAAPELAKAASPERPASPALAADLQLRAAAAAPPAAEEVAAAASGPDQPSVAPAAAARVAAAPAAPAPTPAAPSPPAVARGPPRPGCRRVVGFELIVERMPPEAKILDVEALVEELLALRAGPAARLTPQQALRLLLGCNLSVREAAERADLVQAWRLEHDLAGVRRSLAGCLGGLGVGAGAVPPSACLPGHEQVCQLMVVNPCVLTTVDGRPVSIWHISGARSSAVGSTPDDMLAAWSRATFEYVDLWLSAQSETSGCLAGHVQVFDLSGLGFRLVSNSALQEKLKVALGAGGFYVEVVSHIFVINSGTLFTMAWKVIENFITPRTASKIQLCQRRRARRPRRAARRPLAGEA